MFGQAAQKDAVEKETQMKKRKRKNLGDYQSVMTAERASITANTLINNGKCKDALFVLNKAHQVVGANSRPGQALLYATDKFAQKCIKK